MNFEWDVEKDKTNCTHHGVSFEEASTAFFDPLSFVKKDEKHSIDEERNYLVGLSDKGRV